MRDVGEILVMHSSHILEIVCCEQKILKSFELRLKHVQLQISDQIIHEKGEIRSQMHQISKQRVLRTRE